MLLSMDTSPDISSFVIRFVQYRSHNTPVAYRGVIRHVQSDQEMCFKQWADVSGFIQRFVSLAEMLSPDTTKPPLNKTD